MELMQASIQWASRPADERFTSLIDLDAHCKASRDRSVQRVLSNRALRAAPVEEDETGRALVIVGPGDQPVIPTHWSFGQMAGLAEAPSGYLRNLPAPLAADCLNHGLISRDVEEVGIMLHKGDGKSFPDLYAATGPRYGRIWNSDITRSLVRQLGDGITGAWRVPGEFGQEVAITKENTTLYASDRDLFAFLADERNRIEMPNRRNGRSGSLARGIFISNSEVGAGALRIGTFLFDYACSNRIVWGAENFREIVIRHTSGAPDRWLEQVRPAIQRYAEAASTSVVAAITDAQAKKLGDKERVADFLNKRFTRAQSKAISLAHMAEEQRPIETVWDVVTGATAYARTIEYQDERVSIERKAGELLKA